MNRWHASKYYQLYIYWVVSRSGDELRVKSSISSATPHATNRMKFSEWLAGKRSLSVIKESRLTPHNSQINIF